MPETLGERAGDLMLVAMMYSSKLFVVQDFISKIIYVMQNMVINFLLRF